jgi:hypothetical protein
VGPRWELGRHKLCVARRDVGPGANASLIEEQTRFFCEQIKGLAIDAHVEIDGTVWVTT